MDFKWAIEQLNQGKKVRRSCWDEKRYIVTSNDAILWDEGHTPTFRMKQLLANDWELYDEARKTLSDFIFAVSPVNSDGVPNKDYRIFGADTRVIDADKVKEYIRKLVVALHIRLNGKASEIMHTTKEIFGEDFLR